MPLFTQNKHCLSLLGNVPLNLLIDNLFFVHRNLAKAILYFFCKFIMLEDCCSNEDLNWHHVDNFDIELISTGQFCAAQSRSHTLK